MSILVQPTHAAAPRSKLTWVLSLLAAAFLIILAVSQLFKYESFSDELSTALPGISATSSHMLAALLVIGEIFALPFLLGMLLSPAMRVVSMLLGWLVTATWLSIAVQGALSGNSAVRAGLFGATVSLPAGWWAVGVFVVVAGLIGWVSYARWPFGCPGRIE